MYILIIVLIINGQFNSYIDVKFQEFSNESYCILAKNNIENMISKQETILNFKCVKK